MGKTQKKQGKGRLDKYYHLAKDTGYRARSAFKLIQLAKKFDFLSKSKVALDLCAAPGGWTQVAKKFMPLDSTVIGVDLVPIQAIRGCTTIVADITTAKCRQLLRQELKGQPCDVVLNDGAPNVGANWAKDAFTQAELTLHAAKLACEFLRPGGCFVTKIFRSADYNSLLWVLQQLFDKVDATKPQASRNVSAEIFVVAQNFKAGKIDPRFFEPKYVFMEMENENKPSADNQNLSSLIKGASKKNRKGYEENDDYRTMTAAEFFASETAVQEVVRCHAILFPKDCDEIADHPLTTKIIREFCEDLRVLGKSDLRSLIKWRFKILNEQKKKIQAEKPKFPKQKEEEDPDKELSRLIEKRHAEEKADRKRKREKDKRAALRAKASLGIFSGEQNDPSLFQGGADGFAALEAAGALESSSEEEEADAYEAVLSDDERLERMEQEAADDYEHAKEKAREAKTAGAAIERRKKTETRRERVTRGWAEEMVTFEKEISQRAKEEMEEAEDSDYEDESDEEVEEPKDSSKANTRADRFFSSGLFQNMDMEGLAERRKPVGPEDSASESEEEEEDRGSHIDEMSESELPVIPMTDKQKRKIKRKKDEERQEKKKAKRIAKEPQLGEKQELHSTFATGEQGKGKDFELAPAEPTVDDLKPDDPDELAETLAVGSLLGKKKSRMELIDSGFHRYAFDDREGLPAWFIEDEARSQERELPISKELMQEFRSKLKEINARPIRKVAEAQARKRKRTSAKLEKLRKQADHLAANDDISGLSKVKMLKKSMSKMARDQKQKVETSCSRKTGGRAKGSKGKGSKGAKVSVVDRRLKTDKRGAKKAEKNAKKKARQTGKPAKKSIKKGKGRR